MNFVPQVMEETWKPWTINREAYIYTKEDEKWLRKSGLNNEWFRLSKEMTIDLSRRRVFAPLLADF